MNKNTSTVQDLVSTLKLAAQKHGHRRLLVISGDKDWCFGQLGDALQILDQQKVFFVGETFSPVNSRNIKQGKAGNAREWLGREHQHIIFDAFSGFDVDAFGAISGTLCAGGLFILLTPPLQAWSSFPDPEKKRIVVYPQSEGDITGWYLKRLVSLIQSSDQLSLWCQSGELKIQSSLPAEKAETEPLPLPYKTISQMRAVQAIFKVVRGHRRRPLVMTADRGRGKSAAMGIAVAQLLKEGLEKILITAPAKNTTEVFFHHLTKELGEGYRDLLSRVLFIAPDDLVSSKPSTSLLLVDEAAAIPSPLLEDMLNAYSRIVYTTTVHGYEGTGRGFAIRFKKTLDQQTPNWQEIKLSEPVRWQVGDPLEAFVFSALLLNAAPEALSEEEKINPRFCQFRYISSEELISDERLLHQLFGLLVLAHYQTSPFDLRQLLDGGNVSAFGLFSLTNKLVGVLLTAREGEIETDLMDGIWLGQRRVRGHLLPQSLSNHLGMPDAVTLSGMRLIRIAVHPDAQRIGLGGELLRQFQDYVEKEGADYSGTLFGATDDLLHFWSASGYLPARVGLTRDSASGTHSVMMLKPISADGSRLINQARLRFHDQFCWLLMGELKLLDTALVATLLKQLHGKVPFTLNDEDRQELLSFTHGARQYENCIEIIRRVAFHSLSVGLRDGSEAALLVSKVIQNRSWQEVAGISSCAGEKQARQQLRRIVCTIANDSESSGV